MQKISEIKNKRIILIVEDEPDFGEICKSVLEEYGYETMLATNGQAGIDILASREIDMVLSDGKMPFSDGYMLLNWIRNNQPNTPFVLMTGYLVHSDAELTQLGLDGFFEKPFDLNTLVKFIQDFFHGDELFAQRKFPRINVKLPITIQGESMESEYSGVCLNIGQGGLFVAKTPPYPAVNSLVSFSISENTSRISGSGIVRWKRESPQSGKLPGIGIEFSNVDLNEIKKLNLKFK